MPDRWQPAWRAYLLLNQCRPGGGFGPSGIPLSEIACYVSMFPYHDREELVAVVKAADSFYLKWCDKKTAQAAK